MERHITPSGSGSQRQSTASTNRRVGKRQAPNDYYRGRRTQSCSRGYYNHHHESHPPFNKKQRQHDTSWRAFYLEILRTLESSVGESKTKPCDTNLFQHFLERTKTWEQNDPLTDYNFDVWDLYSKTVLEKIELPNIIKSNNLKDLRKCRDFLKKVEVERRNAYDPRRDHPLWPPVPFSARLQQDPITTFRVCEKLRHLLVDEICAVKNRDLFTSWQHQQLPYLHAVCKCLSFLEGPYAKHAVEHEFTDIQRSKFQTLQRSGQVAVRLACQDGIGATKILSAINQFAGRISKDCFQIPIVDSARDGVKRQITQCNPADDISACSKRSCDAEGRIPSRENQIWSAQSQNQLQFPTFAVAHTLGNASQENTPLQYNKLPANSNSKRTDEEYETGVVSAVDDHDNTSFLRAEAGKRKTLESVPEPRHCDTETEDSMKVLAHKTNPLIETKRKKSSKLAILSNYVATLSGMHFPGDGPTDICSVGTIKEMLNCLMKWEDSYLIDTGFDVYDVYTKMILEKVYLPDLIKNNNSRALQDCQSFLNMIESKRQWFEQPNNDLQRLLPPIPMENSSVHSLNLQSVRLVWQKLRVLLDELCGEKMHSMFFERTVLKLPYLDAVSMCVNFLNRKAVKSIWKDASTNMQETESLLRCGRLAKNLAYRDGNLAIKSLRRIEKRLGSISMDCPGLTISASLPVQANESHNNDHPIDQSTQSTLSGLNGANVSTSSDTSALFALSSHARDGAPLPDSWSASRIETTIDTVKTDDPFTQNSTPSRCPFRKTARVPNHDRSYGSSPTPNSQKSPVFSFSDSISPDTVHSISPRFTNQKGDSGSQDESLPEQPLAKYQSLLKRMESMESLRLEQKEELSHLSEQIETLEGYLDASMSLYSKQKTKLKDLACREEYLRNMVRDNTERTHFLQNVLRSGQISQA